MSDTAQKDRRRWMRYSLRTLFLAVTAGGVSLGWIGWQFRLVGERKAIIKRLRPSVLTKSGRSQYSLLGQSSERIPIWRRWLGDETVDAIALRPATSDEDVEKVKLLFPEAEAIERFDSERHFSQ